MTQPDPGPTAGQRPWRDTGWLIGQARALLDFHAGARDPAGGFRTLGPDGAPLGQTPRGRGAERALHDICRMVHGYALAEAAGGALAPPAAAALVEHGLDWLFDRQQDHRHGGFYWSVDDAGPVDDRKQAYGHAFVLLAAASAARAGHDRAGRLRDLALDAIDRHFWEEPAGAVQDTFAADWTGALPYRGQNANMHLCEALLAAHAVWGEPAHLARATCIAERLIDREARQAGWVVPEHFTAGWQRDDGFDGDAMFRPSGTTPGHALEWARLVLELWARRGRRDDWMPAAAEALFRRAVATGWLAEGGFAYTLDGGGAVSRRWRFWWPCAEGAAAARVLSDSLGGLPFAEAWYDRIWAVIDARFIDHARGGWHHEIDAAGRPATGLFPGKPDLYHALQACLISARAMPG